MDNKDKNVTHHHPVSDKKRTGRKPIMGCHVINPDNPTTADVYPDFNAFKS
ncbi:MAG: hypothetical protein H7844_00460 [Nitrospirae bacterium YQR-1]